MLPTEYEPSQSVVDDLIVTAEAIEYPHDGRMIISEPIVMQTCGYYVGQVCIEYLDFGDGEKGDWLLQPYDRLSDYFVTLEEAEAELQNFVDLEAILDGIGYED